MTEAIALAVSFLALGVSAVTAWLTLLRRGTVRMTQPTVIFLGPDAPQHHRDTPPKIYLRSLLFATSKRGRVIESMHVSLQRNESHQNFAIWVHGDDRLVRGSGLYVSETGIAANHHFLTPEDGSSFQFLAGVYRLNVYARILGESRQQLLFSQELEIPSSLAESLREPGIGIYFDWGPDSCRYLPHVKKRPPSPDPGQFLEALEPYTPVGRYSVLGPRVRNDYYSYLRTNAVASSVLAFALSTGRCEALCSHHTRFRVLWGVRDWVGTGGGRSYLPPSLRESVRIVLIIVEHGLPEPTGSGRNLKAPAPEAERYPHIDVSRPARR